MAVVDIDWASRLVTFDDDIDVPTTRGEIRVLEASEEGIVFDQVISVTGRDQIGAQTSALTVTLINGYVGRFIPDGTYVSSNGNFVGVLLASPGVSFSRELSLAFAEGTVSGLTPEESDYLKEIHGIHGLRRGSPLAVTDTSRQYDTVEQTISDDGTTSTVTRTD